MVRRSLLVLTLLCAVGWFWHVLGETAETASSEIPPPESALGIVHKHSHFAQQRALRKIIDAPGPKRPAAPALELQGTVLDALTGEGVGRASVTVGCQNQDGCRDVVDDDDEEDCNREIVSCGEGQVPILMTTASEDGRFTVCREYLTHNGDVMVLNVAPPGYVEATIRLDATSLQQDLVIHLQPAARMTVQVTDEQGQPVPGALVLTLLSDGTQDEDLGTTDDDGQVQAFIDPKQVTLFALRTDQPTVVSQVKRIDLAPGSLQHVQLMLRKVQAVTLIAKVIDHIGRPVSMVSARVTGARQVLSLDQQALLRQQSIWSDDDGRFVLQVPTPGWYRLRLFSAISETRALAEVDLFASGHSGAEQDQVVVLRSGVMSCTLVMGTNVVPITFFSISRSNDDFTISGIPDRDALLREVVFAWPPGVSMVVLSLHYGPHHGSIELTGPESPCQINVKSGGERARARPADKTRIACSRGPHLPSFDATITPALLGFPAVSPYPSGLGLPALGAT